nr:hypothetical protein [Tanacetum cinerariifolium]
MRSLQMDVDDEISSLVDLHMGCGCGGGSGGGGERIHDDSFHNEDSVKESSLIEVKGFNSKPYLVGLMKQ